MKKLLLLLAMLASLAFGAVDINTASKEELMRLKGIGESIYNNIKDEIIVK